MGTDSLTPGSLQEAIALVGGPPPTGKDILCYKIKQNSSKNIKKNEKEKNNKKKI